MSFDNTNEVPEFDLDPYAVPSSSTDQRLEEKGFHDVIIDAERLYHRVMNSRTAWACPRYVQGVHICVRMISNKPLDKIVSQWGLMRSKEFDYSSHLDLLKPQNPRIHRHVTTANRGRFKKEDIARLSSSYALLLEESLVQYDDLTKELVDTVEVALDELKLVFNRGYGVLEVKMTGFDHSLVSDTPPPSLDELSPLKGLEDRVRAISHVLTRLLVGKVHRLIKSELHALAQKQWIMFKTIESNITSEFDPADFEWATLNDQIMLEIDSYFDVIDLDKEDEVFRKCWNVFSEGLQGDDLTFAKVLRHEHVRLANIVMSKIAKMIAEASKPFNELLLTYLDKHMHNEYDMTEL